MRHVIVGPVPDDERPRRRLGDETKERIADLASGWSLDGPAEAPAAPEPEKPVAKAVAKPPTQPPPLATPPAGAPTRNKPRTNPPPAPGSPERKALEQKIVDSGRTKAPSVPPPAPKPTAPAPAPKPAAPAPVPAPRAPTTGPKYPRANYDGPSPPFVTEARTPPVIVDESLTIPDPVAPAPELPHSPSSASGEIGGQKPPATTLKVPIGEFDSGVRTAEINTSKREAADALLKIPDKITPVEDLLEDDEPPARGDATSIDPQTAKFERGDPTQDQDAIPDATEIQAPSTRMKQHSGGTLRPSAALRRKRGLYGDVRYVFTALFGVRRSKQELAELEHRQSLRQTSRRRHLVTLGRTAVITDTFDHPALGKAREELQAIEDERSRHAGAVSASDAELERVRRDREAKAMAYAETLAAIDAELAELAKKIEPLEKAATAAKKRGQELRESLQRIDKKIAETEALFMSVKAEKLDKSALQADIVTLKADRNAVLRDEPQIAAELDALDPRIAAMEATRAELRRKRVEHEKAETEDHRRTSELLEAIGAKRKVVERAAADAETARDTALFMLGERLYVDRPKILTAQLAPIDTIDLEVGEGDRRIMELREIMSNVDKAKLARGIAMVVVALGVAGSIIALVLSALL